MGRFRTLSGARSLKIPISNTTKELRLEDLSTVDILITEVTYGNINNPARKEQKQGLVKFSGQEGQAQALNILIRG